MGDNGKSAFRPPSSLLLFAPKALPKLAEEILSYYFVRKTPTSRLLAPDDLFEVTGALRPLACGLVVLTASADEEQLFQYMKLGAAAYESRGITAACLADRIRQVAQKEYLISAEAIDRPRPSLPTASRKSPALKSSRSEKEVPASIFPLSAREVEILEYIARGNSNKEIAKSLQISDQTVKNHITSILKKLSVDDRTAAVVHALRHHWIGLESSVSTGR